MTNWYKDIYPCRACSNGPMWGGSKCDKEHETVFVEGCDRCGKLVNFHWYYEQKVCPDFDPRREVDPSGS